MKAAVNTKTRKVACVLLQAMYGGDRRVPLLFDPEDWEIATTDDMHLVDGTQEQWEREAERQRQKRKLDNIDSAV